MRAIIQLTREPIAATVAMPESFSALAGAWLEFRGCVRGEEQGAAIRALEYEAYEPMAQRELERIITDLGRERPCLAVLVRHRLGVVPVGETAIYVGVASCHRQEGLAFLGGFLDRLKQTVPIWKVRSLPLAGPE